MMRDYNVKVKFLKNHAETTRSFAVTARCSAEAIISAITIVGDVDGASVFCYRMPIVKPQLTLVKG